MYEFMTQNPLYIVLLIVLICWLGIFTYLVRIDKKITRLEQRMKE
ncbi:MAG: CcmD family protein [Bacteroidota bacterium]|jgi:CcmD family protein